PVTVCAQNHVRLGVHPGPADELEQALSFPGLECCVIVESAAEVEEHRAYCCHEPSMPHLRCRGQLVIEVGSLNKWGSGTARAHRRLELSPGLRLRNVSWQRRPRSRRHRQPGRPRSEAPGWHCSTRSGGPSASSST